MITAEEADRLAWRWVRAYGTKVRPRLHTFDLGWVVTPESTDDSPRPVGEGRGVLDRETGEISLWPSLPIERVVEMFRAYRPRTPPPRTWDPLRQARRDADRLPYPETTTRLEIDGRVFTARSAKGDGELNLHPIVAAFFRTMPVEYRERGADRTSEVVVVSDTLLAEDAGRVAAGLPLLTVEDARTELFGRARLSTVRGTEPFLLDGLERSPSLSSKLLMRFLGMRVTVPSRARGEVDPSGGSATGEGGQP